ncbi:hypothetical protein [Desulfoscipio gibsoniae]|nr:hypothetical protein [Desulfoscipio gibsoniae]
MLIKRAEVYIKIPYFLEWQGVLEVNISIDNLITMKLDSVKENTSNFEINNGFVKRDRSGRYNTTAIICCFDCNFEYDLNKVAEYQKHYYGHSKKAINKMLYIYKNIYDEYHINPIRDIDILQYNIKFFNEENKEVKFFMSTFGGGYITFGNIESPGQNIRNMLTGDVRFPLWKEYLYKAKDDFDLENYTQCIVNINIALENFIYTHFEERLKGILSEQKINEVLYKYTPCDDCNLKMCNKNHISPGPPSIYRIVKFMYKNAPVPNYKTKEITNVVLNINKYRNDIVHGKFKKIIKEGHAEKAIENFEKLVCLSLEVPLKEKREEGKISNLGFAFE